MTHIYLFYSIKLNVFSSHHHKTYLIMYKEAKTAAVRIYFQDELLFIVH